MEDNVFSIWTPYETFYIHSMLFNTSSALQSCRSAENIIEKICTSVTDSQEVKELLLDCLQNLIIQAGAISRYFSPSRDGLRGTDQKTIHKDRGKYLSKIFSIKNDSPLMNRELRNSIEHFDERLDLYLREGIFGCIFPSLILDEPKDFDVPHHIFRAYYLKEGIFQILGERYEIQPIVDEVARVHNLLLEFDRNGGVFRSCS